MQNISKNKETTTLKTKTFFFSVCFGSILSQKLLYLPTYLHPSVNNTVTVQFLDLIKPYLPQKKKKWYISIIKKIVFFQFLEVI